MQGHVLEPDQVVVDVTDADFQQKVVQESLRRPVLVDLWASWCAPCRTLSPILEKVAKERGGDLVLAKLDVDANPTTASQFGVQSIPTVVAFKDGQPVDGFVGAYPEAEVNRFVDSVLPTKTDQEASDAQQEEGEGDLPGAEQRYRVVLESDPDNKAARLGLARILTDRGDHEEARELVAPLLPDPEAAKIDAGLHVAGWKDLDEKSTLASAKRLAAGGNFKAALDAMLASLQDDPSAREAMVDVFSVLGDDDPLVQEYRRKLASALF
jgi:putative thioredoxin